MVSREEKPAVTWRLCQTLAILAVTFWAGSAAATMPLMSLAELVEKSEVICEAVVERVDPIPDSRCVLVLVRLKGPPLKGSVPNSSIIIRHTEVDYDRSPTVVELVPSASYFLFLKREDALFALSDSHVGAVPSCDSAEARRAPGYGGYLLNRQSVAPIDVLREAVELDRRMEAAAGSIKLELAVTPSEFSPNDRPPRLRLRATNVGREDVVVPAFVDVRRGHVALTGLTSFKFKVLEENRRRAGNGEWRSSGGLDQESRATVLPAGRRLEWEFEYQLPDSIAMSTGTYEIQWRFGKSWSNKVQFRVIEPVAQPVSRTCPEPIRQREAVAPVEGVAAPKEASLPPNALAEDGLQKKADVTKSDDVATVVGGEAQTGHSMLPDVPTDTASPDAAESETTDDRESTSSSKALLAIGALAALALVGGPWLYFRLRAAA